MLSITRHNDCITLIQIGIKLPETMDSGSEFSLGSIYGLELEPFVPLLISTPTPVPLLSPSNSPRPGRPSCPSTLGEYLTAEACS